MSIKLPRYHFCLGRIMLRKAFKKREFTFCASTFFKNKTPKLTYGILLYTRKFRDGGKY